MPFSCCVVRAQELLRGQKISIFVIGYDSVDLLVPYRWTSLTPPILPSTGTTNFPTCVSLAPKHTGGPFAFIKLSEEEQSKVKHK